MEEKKFHNFKNQKFASIAWIMVILVIVIAVILNMIVAQIDFSWDVSPNKQYSLGETTVSYLEELDENGTTIDFYLLAPMDEVEADINSLSLYRALKEYDSHPSINLIDIDPNTDEETMQKLNPDNTLTLGTGDMVLVCGDIKKRVPGNTMYYTETNDDGEIVSQTFRGENVITGTIKSVVDGFTPTIYFLTGHGEKTLEEHYTQFQKNLENYNYLTKSLLLSEVEAVPDDAALIVVAAPTADISDDDKTKLDAYLDKGGNLSLLMSPNAGKFNYTNLDAIMEDFCIIMDYDRIYETDASSHVSGENTTIQCNLVEIEDDSEAADLTSALMNQGLIPFMPESRSFYFIYNDKFSKLTTANLLNTNSTAVGEPYGGEYDSDELTDTGLMLAGYSQDNTRNAAKVAVFGNAEFIDDAHVESSHYLVSVYLYLSTVSWMYNTDVDMGIADKSMSYDYIALTDSGTVTNMMILFAALPIIIIVIGVVVWIRRRNS